MYLEKMPNGQTMIYKHLKTRVQRKSETYISGTRHVQMATC